MILEYPSQEFVSKMNKLNSSENELNNKLLKLFRTFNDESNHNDVIIKVAALNKLYSTAIININPVAEQIVNVFSDLKSKPNSKDEYIKLIDRISIVKWNNGVKNFTRNNLSFSSKYIHFYNEYKTPIYDSYIWILIKGYLGQKNKLNISFASPSNYSIFLIEFEKFRKEFGLEKYSIYEVDKFLWQYGRQLITQIKDEISTNDLEIAKTELKKRIKEAIR